MTPAAGFCEEELQLARRLKAAGWKWRPAPGHFTIDEKRQIERGSPFQDGVYFILNYDRFVAIAGGVDSLIGSMTWLPSYEQCREELRRMGVDDASQLRCLVAEAAFEGGRERVALYRMLLKHLARPSP